KNQRLSILEESLKLKEREVIDLNGEVRALEEKVVQGEKAHAQLVETFKALSSDALEKNSRSFLNLAQTALEKYQESAKGDLEKRQQAIGEMIHPMKEHLSKLDTDLKQLEKERKGDQEALKGQIKQMVETEKELRLETANLVKALRAPSVRG